ncbi:glucosidase [Pedobacter sp. L105]|uniref:MGH1-like glycoside hydrolase domain-containing protein n=1 Tax=Pedobacter sp. L105 TaxID=1641871 RepID=UPI00131D8B90|nr:glucosidase [Pedobacter sp. L105]
MNSSTPLNPEKQRLQDHYEGKTNWLKWGPYVSDRQWGTVREDYSANGDAWNHTTHDTARSKAYRWGEEAIGGFSDDKQFLCAGLALWNGKDNILKERLFGLTNEEGNHGEDVKEIYYFLDGSPTHSYMKMLYKYPLQAFPYQQLIDENRKRDRTQPEFELIDTGLFDKDDYADVFIEYAKNDEDDLLISYTVWNRGNAAATIDVIPQLWYRNTWCIGDGSAKPELLNQGGYILLRSADIGDYYCFVEGNPKLLFTENESNSERLYNFPNATPYVKDGIHEAIVKGNANAVNPSQSGTKVGMWYHLTIPAGESHQIRIRLSKNKSAAPFTDFKQVMDLRIAETDSFYTGCHPSSASDEEKKMQRQAWAGMLWNKQFYSYDVNRWLKGDPGQPKPPEQRKKGRNSKWKHFVANDILSMPDKWEYPWFAAWDLGFHCISFAALDPDFAKKQLTIMVSSTYMHPSGQLAAYEWDFNDVNPPVHAMATWHVYQTDKAKKGKGDMNFLIEVFNKLLLNFTWWVNQKDSEGNNIFEGGFLGLDNIGVFNRSQPVPGGGFLEQADGTSWMAMYALNMMQISMELALHHKVFESLAVKFSEHFLFIAGSISNMGEDSHGLWDEEDGFYYDMLRKIDGTADRVRFRSLVGLIPLFAQVVFEEDKWEKLDFLKNQMDWFMVHRPDLVNLVSHWTDTKGSDEHLLSLLRGHRMKLLLKRMLDPNEFLSDYGIRSVSKAYDNTPYRYQLDGFDYTVKYTPAESDSNMFGGNSNWRGPIWMPMNYLIIESLKNFQQYYTDDFRVEYPTGSGEYHSLAEIAVLLSNRLKSIFLKDENGERPASGGHPKFNHDPYFKDYILFHEYFNGNTGEGLGANHQTGWTGLVALL